MRTHPKISNLHVIHKQFDFFVPTIRRRRLWERMAKCKTHARIIMYWQNEQTQTLLQQRNVTLLNYIIMSSSKHNIMCRVRKPLQSDTARTDRWRTETCGHLVLLPINIIHCSGVAKGFSIRHGHGWIWYQLQFISLVLERLAHINRFKLYWLDVRLYFRNPMRYK